MRCFRRLTRYPAGLAAATLAVAVAMAGAAPAATAPTEVVTSVSTGPDSFPATDRVRGEFTCGVEPGELVSGYFEYRRNVGGLDAGYASSDELLVLSAGGQDVSPALIAQMNAEWRPFGGRIVGISVSCSSDMKRMMWHFRLWRSDLMVSRKDGDESVTFVTDRAGHKLVQQEDMTWVRE